MFSSQVSFQEPQLRQEHPALKHSPRSHHPKPTYFLSTPPPSPMTATLGQPNRSCASCKKRKVKCDRKTPSCSACQKSKHHCHYTSYSPTTVITEETQFNGEDEVFRAMKQKFEEIDKQRWETFIRNFNPALAAKCLNQPQQEERNLGFPVHYYTDDIYNLSLPVGVQHPVPPTLTDAPYQSSYVIPPVPTSP
ncbi:320_t:CDS:2, partial [Acaulospora morrowiae]